LIVEVSELFRIIPTPFISSITIAQNVQFLDSSTFSNVSDLSVFIESHNSHLWLNQISFWTYPVIQRFDIFVATWVDRPELGGEHDVADV
jgi:hypothetical protein